MLRVYKIRILLYLLVTFSISNTVWTQTSIDWQKSFGTTFYDNAMKIMNDEDGNFIVMGTEAHIDLTGDIRNYLMVTKMNTEGDELWKAYHDIGNETNTVAFDFGIGDHFYTVENGTKLINLVVYVDGNFILYKLFDHNGEFNYFEPISSPVLALTRDNEKINTATGCAVQLACYGPDSLTIQKINPIADSNFNTTAWTFGLKQNIRTAPIQGHYDFDNNDIAVDESGNIYLLTQIERWDFNFCTDCSDQFVDAYSMIFKLSPDGELIEHFRLNTTTAVVSSLRFLTLKDGKMVIRVDDINSTGTALLTTIFQLDYELNPTGVFDLGGFYNHVLADDNQNIYTVTNVYDENDPNIKGASDVQVSKFSHEGVFEWKSYYGGTSFDFPKGFVLTSDAGIAILSNTESTDFDIEESFGYQDMWLIKLNQTITGIRDDEVVEYSFYPNPTTDLIRFEIHDQFLDVSIYDMTGKELIHARIQDDDSALDLSPISPGTYMVKATNESGISTMLKLVKI